MPKYNNTSPFMPEEDEFIQENYGKITNSDLANHLKRNFIQVRHRAVKLGVEQPMNHKRKEKPAPIPATGDEAEFNALRVICDALKPLDNDARKRVLDYVDNKLDIEWLEVKGILQPAE